MTKMENPMMMMTTMGIRNGGWLFAAVVAGSTSHAWAQPKPTNETERQTENFYESLSPGAKIGIGVGILTLAGLAYFLIDDEEPAPATVPMPPPPPTPGSKPAATAGAGETRGRPVPVAAPAAETPAWWETISLDGWSSRTGGGMTLSGLF